MTTSDEDVIFKVKYHEETLKDPVYAGADDYRFWCEGCDAIHGIRAAGTPPCWTFNGDLVNPTFNPSHLTGWHGDDRQRFSENRCHSFIENGNIKYLNDCHHTLAGNTVRLLPVKKWRYGGK